MNLIDNLSVFFGSDSRFLKDATTESLCRSIQESLDHHSLGKTLLVAACRATMFGPQKGVAKKASEQASCAACFGRLWATYLRRSDAIDVEFEESPALLLDHNVIAHIVDMVRSCAPLLAGGESSSRDSTNLKATTKGVREEIMRRVTPKELSNDLAFTKPEDSNIDVVVNSDDDVCRLTPQPTTSVRQKEDDDDDDICRHVLGESVVDVEMWRLGDDDDSTGDVGRACQLTLIEVLKIIIPAGVASSDWSVRYGAQLCLKQLHANSTPSFHKWMRSCWSGDIAEVFSLLTAVAMLDCLADFSGDVTLYPVQSIACRNLSAIWPFDVSPVVIALLKSQLNDTVTTATRRIYVLRGALYIASAFCNRSVDDARALFALLSKDEALYRSLLHAFVELDDEDLIAESLQVTLALFEAIVRSGDAQLVASTCCKLINENFTNNHSVVSANAALLLRRICLFDVSVVKETLSDEIKVDALFAMICHDNQGAVQAIDYLIHLVELNFESSTIMKLADVRFWAVALGLAGDDTTDAHSSNRSVHIPIATWARWWTVTCGGPHRPMDAPLCPQTLRAMMSMEKLYFSCGFERTMDNSTVVERQVAFRRTVDFLASFLNETNINDIVEIVVSATMHPTVSAYAIMAGAMLLSSERSELIKGEGSARIDTWLMETLNKCYSTEMRYNDIASKFVRLYEDCLKLVNGLKSLNVSINEDILSEKLFNLDTCANLCDAAKDSLSNPPIQANGRLPHPERVQKLHGVVNNVQTSLRDVSESNERLRLKCCQQLTRTLLVRRELRQISECVDANSGGLPKLNVMINPVVCSMKLCRLGADDRPSEWDIALTTDVFGRLLDQLPYLVVRKMIDNVIKYVIGDELQNRITDDFDGNLIRVVLALFEDLRNDACVRLLFKAISFRCAAAKASIFNVDEWFSEESLSWLMADVRQDANISVTVTRASNTLAGLMMLQWPILGELNGTAVFHKPISVAVFENVLNIYRQCVSREVNGCLDTFLAEVLVNLSMVVSVEGDDRCVCKFDQMLLVLHQARLPLLHLTVADTIARLPLRDDERHTSEILPFSPIIERHLDWSYLDVLLLISPYFLTLCQQNLSATGAGTERQRQISNRLFGRIVSYLPVGRTVDSSDDCKMRVCGELEALCEKGKQLFDALCGLEPSGQCINRYRVGVCDDDQLNAVLVDDAPNFRDYQKEGIAWLNFMRKYGFSGCLCDDLGVGKTLQTLVALAIDYNNSSSSPSSDALHVILSPRTIVQHWVDECRKYIRPNCLNLVALPSSSDATSKTIAAFVRNLRRPQALVVPFGNRRYSSLAVLAQRPTWQYLVVDEAHLLRNSTGKAYAAVSNCASAHRLFLTATPVQNSVADVWALFNLLMPDYLGAWQAFAEEFANPIRRALSKQAKRRDVQCAEAKLKELHARVLPFVMRRLKVDVLRDLPPKTIIDVMCEMTDIQETLYRGYDGGERPNSDERGRQIDATFFELENPRRAVLNHPTLAPRITCDEYDDFMHSGKMIALHELLLTLMDENIDNSDESGRNAAAQLRFRSKLIVFFHTSEVIGAVKRLLFEKEWKHLSVLRLDATVPDTDHYNIAKRFNEDVFVDVLLTTVSAGGVGLNLSGADRVVFFELSWNPATDLQAMDRAHRIGQRRCLTVYRLVTRGSIEERVLEVQRQKREVADALVNEENRSTSAMQKVNIVDNLRKRRLSDTRKDVSNSEDKLGSKKRVDGCCSSNDVLEDSYA